MSGSSRIYLDNAATSWPKPDSVLRAVDHFQRELGTSAGRASYRDAIESNRIVTQARTKMKRLCSAPAGSDVVFGFNGTDVLNTALHGILRPGDHVVTSDAEHNSVLRPLAAMARDRNIEVTHVATDSFGAVSVGAIRDALRADSRLVALTHASNVTGAIQPIQNVAELLADHPAYLLVDGSQTIGHLPLDLSSTPIDLVATSGHKGLLGPLGTGVLLLSACAGEQVESTRQGGTGVDSSSPYQPTALPTKLESGSLNMPGLCGLLAGIEYVIDNQNEVGSVHHRLSELLIDGLKCIDGVSVVGPDDGTGRVGVVSFIADSIEPQELAGVLDSAHAIQVRAGFHCAPRLHKRIGTFETGGTIRVSFGPFNRDEDVSALIEGVRDYLCATRM